MLKEPEEEIRRLREAIVAINTGRLDDAVAGIDMVVSRIMMSYGLDELVLMETKKVPVCICIDDRGWSTCGAPCPLHPPIYTCEEGKCQKKVARGQRCVRCSRK